MAYTPETGHVVTFANTFDNETMYLVDAVGGNRIEVTPINQESEGYSVGFNLSLVLFREMGGTPVVLSDEEMAAMEAVYALKILDAFDLVELAMAIAAVCGPELGAIVLPVSEMERIETELDQFKTGLKFLRDARNGVLV